jgi:CRISPR-associated protein Cas2
VVVLICYDVATLDRPGRRRLRQIAEACQDHGVRVQFSVFECRLTDAQWVKLRADLLSLFKPEEDSLRFYYLDDREAARTEHHGVRQPIDPSGPLVL